MRKFTTLLISVALGTLSASELLPVHAQSNAQGNVIAAPDYDSGASAGSMSDSNFNTPESDGRPGVKFFTLAVQAVRQGDDAHAVDMYKVAASWAYKPAEYNLGVMYFRGQGVPANRALGAAWMVLAAERGDPPYVSARDVMVTLLTKAQFEETDKLWGDLQKTYGDKVALRRAKAQWAWVKTHQTGTRVGGAAGELSVGVMDGGHTPVSLNTAGKPIKTTTTAAGLLQGGSIDGSIAYRQLQQSDDPYSLMFLKNHKGTVTAGPLEPIHPNEDTNRKEQKSPPPSSARPRSSTE